MTANYVLLEKITVGAAGASSVTFSSIPQTGYTDLVVKISARGNFSQAYDTLYCRVNGLTSSIYTRMTVSGNGSGTGSGTSTNDKMLLGEANGNTATANTFGNAEIYFPNYTSSTNKSISTDIVQETNGTEAYMYLNAGLIATTNAITSIQFLCSSNLFLANSTFYLYGVAKLGTTPAIVPYATGGDTIMTDGTYWYHAFLSSGTFTPAKGLSVDVLCIAGGGGGGGANAGGGGGAGGYLYSATQSLATTGYTVTIGAGGAGQTGISGPGTNGSNSQFGSITASVGGGGGGSSLNSSGALPGNGASGGSGGGAGNYNTAVGGAATSGQGFAGGNSSAADLPAGGGGASAAGTNANASGFSAVQGGAGSNAQSSFASATSTGVSGFYAGGGASGANVSSGGSKILTRSAGGGGNGTAGQESGVANTGSGGVGQSFGGSPASPSGAGGSGIVIIRYAV
jgi:hypothetical protein